MKNRPCKHFRFYLFLTVFFSFSVFQVTHAQKPKYKFGDYIQFGRVALSNGHNQEAIQYLNAAINHRPASYEGYFLRGIAKYYLDDYLGAESDFTIAMQYDPYNGEIYHYRGIVRSQQYNFGGALADYATAIHLNPKNPIFYLNRARSYLFLKVYDSSLVDCNKSISLKYKDEDVYVLRGMAYAGKKAYRLAISDFNRAIKKNPEITNAYVQRGSVFMDMKQADSAISDFNKAIAMNPNDSYAIFNRGLARMETKDTLGAFQDLNLVIELSPRNSYAYYNRAILKIGGGDEKGAIEDLDKVVALNPDNIVVFLYRGRLKAGIEDLKGAIKDFNKAIEIYPEFADAYYERSRVKKQQGDFDGADEDYKFAFMINDFNFKRSDSLNIQEEMYLRRIMAFSGEFKDKRESAEQLEAETIDIQLLPVFVPVLFAKDLKGLQFYDTYSKSQYHMPVVTLLNNPELINTHLALDELNKPDSSLPYSGDDYLKKAGLYADLTDYSNALDNFEKAITTDPGLVLAYFGRANTRLKLTELFNSGMHDDILFNVNTSYPKSDKNRDNKPETYSYEKIIDDYSKVIAMDPEFQYAWYNRAFVKALKGDYWGAVGDYSKAINLDPNFADAYYNKGLLLIYLNLKTVGCKAMSHAGELGQENAYKVMKRYCVK